MIFPPFSHNTMGRIEINIISRGSIIIDMFRESISVSLFMHFMTFLFILQFRNHFR